MSEPDLPINELGAQRLSGGWETTVRRAGGVVHRSASPWSDSVMELLSHLEREGFEYSPRPIGSGFDDDGNELLSFLEGESPHPRPWDDDAIVNLGGMLARLHAALGTFRPRSDAAWKPWFGRELGDPRLGFGHGDLGPWNIIAVHGQPCGFIDWDTAGPIDPIYELAQAAWLNVQLHADDIAERNELGDATQRAQQLGLMLDAYALPSAARRGFVDKMVEIAIHDAAQQAIEHEITPETTTGTAGTGYPFAWGIAWRARSASWMLHNRDILEAAIDQRTL